MEGSKSNMSGGCGSGCGGGGCGAGIIFNASNTKAGGEDHSKSGGCGSGCGAGCGAVFNA